MQENLVSFSDILSVFVCLQARQGRHGWGGVIQGMHLPNWCSNPEAVHSFGPTWSFSPVWHYKNLRRELRGVWTQDGKFLLCLSYALKKWFSIGIWKHEQAFRLALAGNPRHTPQNGQIVHISEARTPICLGTLMGFFKRGFWTIESQAYQPFPNPALISRRLPGKGRGFGFWKCKHMPSESSFVVSFLLCFWSTPFAQKQTLRISIASKCVLKGFSEKWHSLSLVLPCLRPMDKCHSRAGCRGGSQGTPRCSWNTPPENDTWKIQEEPEEHTRGGSERGGRAVHAWNWCDLSFWASFLVLQ